MTKRSIDEEIIEFFRIWGMKDLEDFLRMSIPLYELYDVSDENDWVEQEVGPENLKNVCAIRTIYLISKMCDYFSGKFSLTRSRHGGLWKKLEKIAEETNQKTDK